MSPSSSGTGAGTERGQRHRGPSLFILAIVFAGLFIASLVVVAAMTHGGHFPSPLEPSAATNAFFAENRDALRFGAFLQFGGLTAGRACTFIGGSPLAKPLKWRPDDLRKLGQ